MTFRPRHLSVSSVALFEQCPLQWRRRYVDKLAEPTSVPMLFGTVFHKALEAEHRGDDSERALVAAWNAADAALAASGQQMHPGKAHALALLERYRRLGHGGQMGEPERKFLLPLPTPKVPVPVLGYIDLPIPERRRFREFKTTSTSSWTATKVALEHQLHVYGWAYQNLYRHRAEMAEYAIFGTGIPSVEIIEAVPMPDGFRVFEKAAEGVWKAITEQRFDGCGACDVCKPPAETTGRAGPTIDWEATA